MRAASLVHSSARFHRTLRDLRLSPDIFHTKPELSKTEKFDLVRLVRLGRSTAAGQGRAYMLRIDPGADRVDLYRGTSSRCNPVAGWIAVVGAGCAGGAPMPALQV